jgi:glutamate 5-kinase
VTLLVKFGSALVSAAGGLDHRFLRVKCAELATLVAAGTPVVVVSSGAVAAGMEAQGIERRPTDVLELQLLSGIGQVRLMRCYRDYLKLHRVQTAQVLLTHYNFATSQEGHTVTAILQAYLDRGIIPVVNENDLVDKEELEDRGRFTDNDVLAALVAERLSVDVAMLLSTVPGLLDRDGRLVDHAERISAVRGLVDDGTSSGLGGMSSKLDAAERMTKLGIDVIVGDGRRDLGDLLSGAAPRTFFAGARKLAQGEATSSAPPQTGATVAKTKR